MGRGTSSRTARRAIPTIAAVAGMACLAACAPVGTGEALPASSPSVVSERPSPAPTSTLRPDVRPGTLPTAQPALAPERLRIPALGVDMPVTDVGVEPSGQMELPVDPATAGWYRYGPDADSTAGNIMLAAHVDAVGYPIGPLAQLRSLAAGESVEVQAADGSIRSYVVESLTFYEKSALPTADLFAREGAQALVIITCGGPFDSSTGHYRDNVVAVARPA